MNIKKIIKSLEQIANEHNIFVGWSNELSPTTPPIADFKKRRILMNLNYGNYQQLPFQLAHEIAHIIDHASNDEALY